MEPWADNLYTNSFLDSVPPSFSNIDDIKSFLYLNIMRLMMFRKKKKKEKILTKPLILKKFSPSLCQNLWYNFSLKQKFRVCTCTTPPC